MSYVVLKKLSSGEISAQEKNDVHMYKDSGIVIHSWLGKIVRNIASFCTRGYVVGVVDFKVGNKTLHLNFKSLNDWIEAKRKNKAVKVIDSKDCTQAKIKAAIDKVLDIATTGVSEKKNKGSGPGEKDL